jgi:hypothetical protein
VFTNALKNNIRYDINGFTNSDGRRSLALQTMNRLPDGVGRNRSPFHY